ncbi:hypothetical protein EMIHUDRAFT_194550 [Emiliania huxleyi CCMP1516]|uniref:SAM-dependent MTase RsmB/NOP-type domain-containing protein n=2 Tax=Emiliania huxleyi TaxID=2903 RepID=A0A0D3L1Q7_EMIH1|nr:hypothetical protein EMIHUDRAFT_194550 [Emiliania huxleyi CCMP1516]EOD41942.1 hypothetical protein EMIHUDRAFT_194550 [Emiliania huxleyi CCMP1516]|eukprot:XP_005794371.1 hypothetical protein EMIHUDRAFT_194550 [Emiliania huxleyi CCMP1516]
MPRRSRSKSLVRSRKRKAGDLASQRLDDGDEEPLASETSGADKTRLGRASSSNPNALWPDCDAWRPKSMFDVYYRLTAVVPREEWPAFSDSLRRPLPITFRFTRDAADDFRAEGERVLSRWAAEGLGTRRLGLVEGWQLHMDKHQLREAVPGSDAASVREWLIRGTESGLLVRQEVASMLPAATLGVLPHHRVLDMCAAPGSKTTQLVERLDGGGGVVVANDFSALRCFTLVPCTGDGTTRKHPEVFHRWEVALALRQHPLQLQIAMRGCALLEVGGLLCYSTCSLNPIENEAVVAALLHKCGGGRRGAVEVESGADAVAAELAGGCAPGMSTWPLLDFRLARHRDLASLRASARFASPSGGSADVPVREKRLYRASMWPPTAPSLAAQLRRCVRLLPHRSDSGGFFVALLRKARPISGNLGPPICTDGAGGPGEAPANRLRVVHAGRRLLAAELPPRE